MLRLRSSSSTISAPRPTRSTSYSGRYGPAMPTMAAASASTAAPRNSPCRTCELRSRGSSATQALGKAPRTGANSGSSASGSSANQAGWSKLTRRAPCSALHGKPVWTAVRCSCGSALEVAAAAAERDQPARVGHRRVAGEELCARPREEDSEVVAQRRKARLPCDETRQSGGEHDLAGRLV